jgi:phage terminase large subunit-like protein
VRADGVSFAASAETAPAPAARDFLGLAAGYERDVLDGRIVACQPLRWAIERQQRDRKRADADPSWPYVWSPEHAVAVCAFAETLPHVEGQWATPTIRLEPWQVWLLSTLFGWRHRADVTRRRFGDCYIEIGRKNSKSVLAVVILLYCFLYEGENGPQVKCGATTRSQTDAIFVAAKKMLARMPALRKEFGLSIFANAIICDKNSGSFQPINSKSSSQDGLNPHAFCVDELHAFDDRGLYDVLASARGARRNALGLSITTAGYSLLGPAYEQRTFLLGILRRTFEVDSFFGLIFTLDEGDDPFDEAVWPKANPNLGVSVSLDDMRALAQRARFSPDARGEFLTKRLNQWLSSSSAWLSMPAWNKCADPSLKISDFAGRPCIIAADLAERDDLTCVLALFERDGILYGFPKFFLPRDVIDERSRAVPAYRVWTELGVLQATDGPMTDLTAVETYMRALVAKHDVKRIVVEQFGGQFLASKLLADGLPVLLQGKSAKLYTPGAQEIEARIRHQKFRHDGNSALTWMASNAVVERRADQSLLPKKPTPNSPNKIDGIDALVLAVSEWLASGPAVPQREMYQAFMLR